MKKKSYIIFIVLFLLILVAGWLQIRRNLPPMTKPTSDNHAGGAAGQAEQPQYIAVTVLQEPRKAEPKQGQKMRPEKREVATKKSVVTDAPNKSSGKQDNGNSGGEPNFYAEYDLRMDDYLSFMRQRGAKVIVYNLANNSPVCEVEASGKLTAAERLDDYSRNSRRITDDYPGADKLLKRVERQFGGHGSYEILLLLPEALVDSIESQVRRIVALSGLNMTELSTVFLRYKGNRSSVTVHVERVSGKTGSRTIGKAFRL